MNAPLLTQDQKDALQEIANIGMGQAGASIAKVLDEFVQLSIPRVLFVPPEEIPVALALTIGEGQVSSVRQAFHGSMRGEALLVYGDQRCNDLADLMGYDGKLDHASELELLLDVSNVLAGACLGEIAKQLGMTIGFSAPSLMADAVPLESLLQAEALPWKTALLVEVNFRLEQRSFACHLVMLMPENEVAALAAALDRFLESF
ncbi:MAG: chemotaxis protein CheC [Rhodocyclales bacterium]|nr:chemotaxis protein CheC [Rhodocyclales bacterium]